jgi:hypothetical protein
VSEFLREHTYRVFGSKNVGLGNCSYILGITEVSKPESALTEKNPDFIDFID